MPRVATREGGVDRNKQYVDRVPNLNRVATREGGVDRNRNSFYIRMVIAGRHPRGWRG